MLVGTYTRTVDDKWRLPVPAELLAGEVGAQAVVGAVPEEQ